MECSVSVYAKHTRHYLLNKFVWHALGMGVRNPTPEKLQNIGFLSNTGPDLLKNHKTTKQAFNVGP